MNQEDPPVSVGCRLEMGVGRWLQTSSRGGQGPGGAAGLPHDNTLYLGGTTDTVSQGQGTLRGMWGNMDLNVQKNTSANEITSGNNNNKKMPS